MKGFEIINNRNVMYVGKHYLKVFADDRSKPQCNKCVFNTDPNEADEVCIEIGNNSCDCVNGEYWIEDTMEIKVPEGCEMEKVSTGEGKVMVKLKAKEPKYPKSWEEFCRMNHETKVGESCIMADSSIRTPGCTFQRCVDKDKNLLPDRATTEAVLALCQLIQLRDAYNGDWVPNWRSNIYKYVIYYKNHEIVTSTSWYTPELLYFKTKELCDEFLRNFRPLIEKLKPLYGIKERGEE